MKGCLYKIIPILLLSISAAVILAHPRADSPGDMSKDTGLYFDPPSKCHNARNLILYGKWITDEWSPYIHSPIYTLAQAGIFKLFGVGLLQMRILSILVSLVSLLLIYLIARYEHKDAIACLTLALCSLGYCFLIYGQSALLEPFAIFFMLLTTWTMLKGYTSIQSTLKSSLWMSITGLSCSAMFLSKPIAFYFLLAVIITLISKPPQKRCPIILFALCLGIPLILYFGPFMYMNRAYFLREEGYWFSRALHGSLFINWISQPLFISLFHTRILLILACLSLLWTITKTKSVKQIPSFLMALTFIIGSQFLAFVNYRPPRYYLPLFIPCIFLTINTLVLWYRWIISPKVPDRYAIGRIIILYVIISYILSFGIIYPLFTGTSLNRPSRLLLSCIFVIAIITLWKKFGQKICNRLSRISSYLRKTIYIICTIGILSCYFWPNINSSIKWLRHPQYFMYEFSKMLDEQYKDMIIVGGSPLFAVMENSHQAHKVTSYHLNWSFMEKKQATHALILKSAGHYSFLKRQFPQTMKNLSPLEYITIAGHTHILYALDLKPLLITSEINSRNIRFSLQNPDPYTPQSCCIIIISQDNSKSKLVSYKEMKLLPSKNYNAEFPIDTSNNKKTLKSYIIPRNTWCDIEQGIIRHRTRLIADRKAWNIDTISFKRKKDFLTGSISIPLDANYPIWLVGIRVKGDMEENDYLGIQWLVNGEMVSEKTINPGIISPTEYRSVFFIIETKISRNAELRIVFKGKGKVLIDALFALNEKELEEKAIWKQTTSF